MHAAWMLDQGGRARKEVSMAKVQVATRCTRRLMWRSSCRAPGASRRIRSRNGFTAQARAARLVDGASEVHMMVLARFMREEGRDFWQWGPGEGRRNER
jgi:acyl-CoA dehydrogenase